MTGEPSYIELGVPDADRALAFVSPVTDSPRFGRWAECRDDQGVRFGLR
jgi:hypothetical protein